MHSAEIRTHASGVVTALSWLLLMGVIALIVDASLRPPGAVPASSAATEFSSERAMRMLQRFAARPHPVGSADHEQVQQFLVGQMQALGLETVVETHTGVEGRGRRMTAARVSNLVGRLKGTENTRAVMLVAHYDTVDRAPGAGDDGGGVAAILETIRALRAGARLKNEVVVLLTDGEELGLLGARAAVVHDPWLQHVGVMFNFEGRGDHGPSVMFETSDANHGLLSEFVKAAPYKTGSSLLYTIYKHMPNDTDYTVFKKAGVAGLNFAWLGRSETYHSRLDTPGNLDERGLQQDGSYALALTREFGNLDLNQLRTNSVGDEVYFNVYGMWMMHYPGTVVKPLAGLLTLAFVIVLIRGVRRGRLSVASLFGATGVSLLLTVAVTLTTVAVYSVEQWLFSRRMLVGDVPANTWLFVGMLLFGIAVWMAIFRYFRERWGVTTLTAGACLLVWVLTMVMTFTLPLASYLFFWPLVFATLSLTLMLRSKHGETERRSATAAWVCTIPTLLLLSPAVLLFFVALSLGPPLAVACGLVLGIGLLLIAPLASQLIPNRTPIGALLLSGTLAIAVGGVLSRPTAQHPRPDTLVYRLDAGSGKAQWGSFDKRTDPWTAERMTASPQRGKLMWPGPVDLDGFVADAPAMALAAPELKIASSTQEGDVRTVRMQVTSARKASWLRLQLGAEAEVLQAVIDGEEAQGWPANGYSRYAPPKTPWALNLYGYNTTGVEVLLRLKGRACSATLTDEEYGLPGMVNPRPENRMAWYGSDYTIVTRQLAIC